MSMLKVYIASPYWHEDPAIRQRNVARQMETASACIDCGYAPFWPLHSHYLNERYHRDEAQWLALSCEWVKVCDVMLRLPGASRGADIESALAITLNIPIFENLTEIILYERNRETLPTSQPERR